MNARGERIIIFGDSLTQHSSGGAEIWDVNAGSNRTSSAPGDLLASLLLEQGAQAVRTNARVGRSAWNFWNREDTARLLASDQAFQPTKVVVMLGTNDVGLNPTLDREAFRKIRDTYKAMGAEVWAVGPFANTSKPDDGVDAVAKIMREIFGVRFVDGRAMSTLVHPGRDGLHYAPQSARVLALAIADALLSKASPGKILGSVALGLLGVGGAIAAGLAWKRHKERQLGDVDGYTPEQRRAFRKLIGLGKVSRDEIDELIQNPDPAALDVVQDAMLERGDKVSKIAKISGIVSPHTFANFELKLGGQKRLVWRVTQDGPRCTATFKALAGKDAGKAETKVHYYGAGEWCERAAAADAWAMAKAVKRIAPGGVIWKAEDSRALLSAMQDASTRDNSEPAELYGIDADVDAHIQVRDMIRSAETPEELVAVEDFAMSKGIRLRDFNNIYLNPGRAADEPPTRVTTKITRIKAGTQTGPNADPQARADDPTQEWEVEHEIWWNGQKIDSLDGRPYPRITSWEKIQATAAAERWAIVKALKKLPTDATPSRVRRETAKAANSDATFDEPNIRRDLYGPSGKGVTFTDLIRDDDPNAMQIAEDFLLERGWKLRGVTGGMDARNFTIDFGKEHWYNNPDGKMVQASVWRLEGDASPGSYPANKPIPRTIKIVAKNGNARAEFEQKITATAEEARKYAVAAAWAIAKALKPLPPNTPESEIQAIADGVQKTLRNARSRPKLLTNGELFGVNIVDGKRYDGSEASLIRDGYQPAPCASGLDKKGLARCWSKNAELAGFRVAYGSSDAHGTFRVFDPNAFESLDVAMKRMRAYKRQGFWTWIEDEQGNFVPVPGAKSERVRKGYPLRERDKPLGERRGLPDPSDDQWDVAMDAILEHDPKRAAKVWHALREEHGFVTATPEFLKALHEVPADVRWKFEEYVAADPRSLDGLAEVTPAQERLAAGYRADAKRAAKALEAKTAKAEGAIDELKQTARGTRETLSRKLDKTLDDEVWDTDDEDALDLRAELEEQLPPDPDDIDGAAQALDDDWAKPLSRFKSGLDGIKISTKDPQTMTAAEINKELDKLDKEDSRVNGQLIEAGRGHERFNETYEKDDPLAREFRALHDRRTDLRVEMHARYGKDAPRRLPIKRGWYGPRRKPGLDGVREQIPSHQRAAIEPQIDDAEARARAAGATGELEYVGAGAEGIVFCDERGLAYKVDRWRSGSLRDEARWLQKAAQIPAIKQHIPKHVRYDTANDVLVRECVRPQKDRWRINDKRLWQLHERLSSTMAAYGHGRPEFKTDAYVYTRGRGPVLIDAGFAIKRGQPLVEETLEALKQDAPKQRLRDLAFALRWERGSTVPAPVADRLLHRLKARDPEIELA